MSLTTHSVKPEDFKTVDFQENWLEDLNKGRVAGNVVRTCQRLRGWRFTWSDYIETRVSVLGMEQDILDEFVRKDGLLSRDKYGVYCVLDAFIETFYPAEA